MGVLNRAGGVGRGAGDEQVRRSPEKDIPPLLLPRLDRPPQVVAGQPMGERSRLLEFGKPSHEMLPQFVHHCPLPDHGEEHRPGVDPGGGMAGNLQQFVDQFRGQIPVVVAAHRPSPLDKGGKACRIRQVAGEHGARPGIPAEDGNGGGGTDGQAVLTLEAALLINDFRIPLHEDDPCRAVNNAFAALDAALLIDAKLEHGLPPLGDQAVPRTTPETDATPLSLPPPRRDRSPPRDGLAPEERRRNDTSGYINPFLPGKEAGR